jgi:signal peptidase I
MRDRIELVTMAVVMALFLKGFLVDAYKIPTGSMQPTLFGDERSGIFDRILVDRVCYAVRAPRRFEVAVFRYPLDRSKTYVKRVVGVGPEELKISDGDLFRRDDASQPWTILRRPEGVQAQHWLSLDRRETEEARWAVATAGRDWSVSGRDIQARGNGRAQFQPERGSIRDGYMDGYEEPLASLVRPRAGSWGRHAVGDLRVEATVTALPGAWQVTLELFEGARRYAFRLPGPAALGGDAAPRIEVLEDTVVAVAVGAPWRLPAGRPVRVRAQNLDDRLELEVEGLAPLALEIEPAGDQTSAVFVGVEGEGADLGELSVWRDVYYTSDEAKRSEYAVPAGSYLMLGDNSQDSSDSRDWMLWRMEVSAAGAGEPRIVRGDARRGENPRTVNAAELEGPTTLFRDEWGEDHWIPVEAGRALAPEHVPFVPRDQILGRALAVFWPLDPIRRVWRLGLVR